MVLLPIESVYVRLRLDVLSVPLPGLGAAELILFHAISAAVMQATEANVIIMRRRLEVRNVSCRFRDMEILLLVFESRLVDPVPGLLNFRSILARVRRTPIPTDRGAKPNQVTTVTSVVNNVRENSSGRLRNT